MSQSMVDRMKHLLSTAHKLVLKDASEVFAAMFRFDAKNEKKEFASANCPVEVSDVEAAAFKVMLSFIYTDDLSELNGDNAMAVLYAGTPLGRRYVISPASINIGHRFNRQRGKIRQIHFGTKQNERDTFYGIEKVSEFAREIIFSERKSETVLIKGIPWKIWAKIKTKNGSTDNEKWLGIYLLCVWPKEDSKWRCKCLATFRIVSQNSVVARDMKEMSKERIVNNKSTYWGFSNFISFAALMDPSKGLYDTNKDKVTLAIDVTVKEAKTEDKS
ncbi:hypothetical protein niasHT_021450 [Heterodera trifolii]|uniref:BTB domain-containing protein n=1 Tax=Heterodera trifolii TaxID=157864 RepID=A0ABD2KIM0_9BILA